MANRKQNRWRSGGSGHDADAAAAVGETTTREQAIPRRSGPESGKLTKKGERPQITLRNGAVVDARRAVAIVEELQITLQSHPEEFRSLLALAENRPQDAAPQHFEQLWARALLTNDRSIDPTVREVLLNCYQVTPEGPVVVPLRLEDAADLPVAERAQQEMDRQLRNILRKPRDDEGPSRI